MVTPCLFSPTFTIMLISVYFVTPSHAYLYVHDNTALLLELEVEFLGGPQYLQSHDRQWLRDTSHVEC